MSASLHRKIPFVLAVLGLAGVGIGGYLTVAHWGDQPIACGGVGDCGYVNSSEYASVGGVAVSALGALLYLAMTAVAVTWARFAAIEWLPIAYWGLALAGAGYAGYLTYVELAVLHAICVWCVTSAVLLAISLGLASIAVFAEHDGGYQEAALHTKDGLGTQPLAGTE
jgi:uncharacterized membrane protein